jgi:hypothetical protein
VRIRTDRVNASGTVTLRHGGGLYHFGVGCAHAGTRVVLLVNDLHIRIIGVATGEVLRELILDPARNYQPTGTPSAAGSRSGLRTGTAAVPLCV